MFEIHGWGYAVYVIALTVAFGCGYYWRISEERRHARENVILSEEQWAHFVHAMENPKPPTRSMRDAITLYDKLVEQKTALLPKGNKS